MKKLLLLFFASFAALLLTTHTAYAADFCDESNGGQNGLVPCGSSATYRYEYRCSGVPGGGLQSAALNMSKLPTATELRAAADTECVNKYGGSAFARPETILIDPNTPRPPTNTTLACRCEIYHIFILALNIFNFIAWKIAPLLAGLLVVAGGVLYVISGGNPGLVSMARRLWWGAAIGLLFIFGSWLIVNIVLTALGVSPVWTFNF